MAPRPLGLCIYCSTNEADADEHWIPRALGSFQGYEPLTDRLCQDCNEHLGVLDEELARTGIVGFARALHRVRGRRRHRKVNPFYYGVMKGKHYAPSLMMTAGHGRWRILGEIANFEGRKPALKPMRQLVFRTRAGAIQCVPFPRYRAAKMRVLLRRWEIQDTDELVEVYLSDDELFNETSHGDTIRGAIGRPFAGVAVRFGLADTEGTFEQVPARFTVTKEYARAIAKVGFHYFLYVFPHLARGDEAEFGAIRDFIFDGRGDADHFVAVVSTEDFVSTVLDREPITRASHYLAAAFTSSGTIAVSMHLFRSREFPTPPSVVRLHGYPSPIRFDAARMHGAHLTQTQDGHDGVLSEISLQRHRIIRPWS